MYKKKLTSDNLTVNTMLSFRPVIYDRLQMSLYINLCHVFFCFLPVCQCVSVQVANRRVCIYTAACISEISILFRLCKLNFQSTTVTMQLVFVLRIQQV